MRVKSASYGFTADSYIKFLLDKLSHLNESLLRCAGEIVEQILDMGFDNLFG